MDLVLPNIDHPQYHLGMLHKREHDSGVPGFQAISAGGA
jgi:hypothetical protein